MKKNVLLVLVLLFVSCLPDDVLGPGPLSADDINQSDALFQQNFGTPSNANFIGRVVNENGEQISGVQIAIGNTQTLTDHNGIFVLNNASVFEKFAYIKAYKEGYLQGSRTIVPTFEGSNFVVITLLEKNIVGTVNSGEVSEVTLNDSKITFLGDFVDANDNPYNGQVEVSVHYLKPNEESTFRQMPGSLFAQDVNNDAVSLETYGMLNVNLFSPSGEQLNITESSPATLEFPVDSQQTSIAPESMNLWYFDDAVGYWKEEGVATKIGDTYQAEVTHFSWWNCDLPLDYINVCFTLMTEDGALLPNNYVEIIRNLTGQTIFTGYTDDNGQQCGLFPANEDVTIYVNGQQECQEEIIHEEIFGPFTNDINFTVSVALSNNELTQLLAIVNNCSGEPIVNGYAFLFTNDESIYDFQLSIESGSINSSITYCDLASYNIIIYDLDANQNSGVLTIDLEPDTTDLGVLTTCNENGVFDGDVLLQTQQEVDNFGLIGFSEITGTLSIGPIEDFSDINDLSSLTSLITVSNLNIQNNFSLTSLSGLNSLNSITNFEIDNNPNLQSIEALSNVSGHLNSISLVGSVTSQLQSLNGLQGITSCNNVSIQELHSLVSLQGLEGLISIEEFKLFNNDGITSIETLFNTSITEEIMIGGNENLVSLNGLNPENQLNAISISALLVNSLEPLSNVSQLTSLIINGCNITSLEDLNNLESIGKFQLSNNSNITSIEAMSSTIITEEIIIIGNNSLTSLDGLNPSSQLSKINISAPLVDSLAPLSNINQLVSLVISDCAITSLEDLNSLESITGTGNASSWIIGNDNLVSLNGLENLSNVGSFYIGTVPNGSPLPNSQLTNYCALENLVNNGNYGNITIENNAYNPTVQDIIDGNCSL